MSNKNIPAVEFSLSDRQPFDYVSCEGLLKTRSCYHTRRRSPENAQAPRRWLKPADGIDEGRSRFWYSRP